MAKVFAVKNRIPSDIGTSTSSARFRTRWLRWLRWDLGVSWLIAINGGLTFYLLLHG